MKIRWIALVLAGLIMLYMAACTSPASDQNGHPADHTINENGAFHKPGLNDPLTNCVLCHGEDLKGGAVGISCFKCHGQKW